MRLTVVGCSGSIPSAHSAFISWNLPASGKPARVPQELAVCDHATCATGTYTLSVGAAGNYNLVFYDATGSYQTQWYSGAQFEGLATPVAVTAGAATTGIDATLTSAAP